MKKRTISLVLILCMLFTMYGCSRNDSGKDKNTGSTGVTAEENQAAGEDGTIDYPFAAYKDTVTISTVTSEYASAKYPEGDDITNNVWTRAYKDKFNVNLVTDWVSDEYDTKLNLAITSQEIPDVFHVSAAQLQQLIDADMVWDLTEVYEKYASDTIKNYMAADEASFESGKKDGRIYGIPQMHWGFIEQPDFVWIRNDWKEELGLPDPTSMADVKNIALKFMEAHGGYGIAADQSLDYLNLLAVAWHAYPDTWIKGSDGSIVYGSIQPEMKNALKEWAEWYKEGILNPDFGTTDFNAMTEAMVAGKVGITPFYQWWGYNPGVDEVTNLGKDAIFYPYAIPSADGQEVKQSISFANGSYTVVSKKCKNPEAAFKLINFYAYMINESTGKETPETISAFSDNDMAHVVGAFRVLNPNCDYDQYVQVSKALETGDTSNLTTSGMWQKYNNSVAFRDNGTPGALGDYLQQGAPKCAYGISKGVIDKEQYIRTALWGATPEELLSFGSTLDDILTEGYTKIIMGEENIDYFDTVVANWKAAGGDAATTAVNAAYGDK